MSKTDTSAEAAKRLAGICGHGDDAQVWSAAQQIAVALDALLAERDAAEADARSWQRSAELAKAERDAARAEVARLRVALRNVLPVAQAWVDGAATRNDHLEQIAREVVDAARVALAQEAGR